MTKEAIATGWMFTWLAAVFVFMIWYAVKGMKRAEILGLFKPPKTADQIIAELKTSFDPVEATTIDQASRGITTIIKNGRVFKFRRRRPFRVIKVRGGADTGLLEKTVSAEFTRRWVELLDKQVEGQIKGAATEQPVGILSGREKDA